MMMRFTNKALVRVYYWFGVVTAAFGFFTEISGQQVYLSSGFYQTMAIIAFLASIALSRIDRDA
jgi:hypothetical protein